MSQKSYMNLDGICGNVDARYVLDNLQHCDVCDAERIDAASFTRGKWRAWRFARALRTFDLLQIAAFDPGGRLIGYSIVAPERGFGGAKSFVRLRRIAVHPDWRQMGIASRMIEGIFGALRQVSSRTQGIHLEVPEGLLESQLFFRSCGFRCSRLIQGKMHFERVRFTGDRVTMSGEEVIAGIMRDEF